MLNFIPVFDLIIKSWLNLVTLKQKGFQGPKMVKIELNIFICITEWTPGPG
jgi:hypothetical protein